MMLTVESDEHAELDTNNPEIVHCRISWAATNAARLASTNRIEQIKLGKAICWPTRTSK